MSEEMREHIDTFKKFILKENLDYDDFTGDIETLTEDEIKTSKYY